MVFFRVGKWELVCCEYYFLFGSFVVFCGRLCEVWLVFFLFFDGDIFSLVEGERFRVRFSFCSSFFGREFVVWGVVFRFGEWVSFFEDFVFLKGFFCFSGFRVFVF